VRAIDTNVIVRFLTGDHPQQARKARAIVEGGDLFVPTSVLLETEWVLRSAYGFDADKIVAALRALAGLPGLALEEPILIARALDWTEKGMDFADALHLGKAEGCSAFVSFDRKLAKAANGLSEILIEAP
jgi:predicted nucleic-acid-binding protein